MGGFKWSNDEIDILSNKYSTTNLEKLMSDFFPSRSRKSIITMAGRFGLKQEIPKETTKKCGCCKQTFPKTEDYFFKRLIKQETGGKQVIYHSFKSSCKKCFGRVNSKRERDKRIKKLGCTEENYKENYLKQMGFNHVKFKKLYNLSISKKEKNNITKFCTEHDYTFTTMKAFLAFKKKLWIENWNMRRIHPLPKGYNFIYELPSDLKKKMYNERPLTEAKLANWLGFKKGDLPKEILEVKELLVQITTYIKSDGRDTRKVR